MANKRRDLETCKSGAEFIREIRTSPAIRSERWAGDHYTVETAEGRITLCNSRRELPGGLRRRIVRAIIAIGLAVMVLVWLAPQFMA